MRRSAPTGSARPAPPVRIRHASPDDATAIAALLADTFDARVLPGWTPRAIARLHGENPPAAVGRKLAEAACARVAASGACVIGAALARRPDAINFLVVSPRWQRVGIGAALMKRVLRDIDVLAPDQSSVEVNATEYSAPFYHRIGFYPISGWVEQGGCRYMRMAYWRLSPLRHRHRRG